MGGDASEGWGRGVSGSGDDRHHHLGGDPQMDRTPSRLPPRGVVRENDLKLWEMLPEL